MSEVRSAQLQKSALRLARRWWPAVLIPGLAVAALVGHGSSALQGSLTTTESPAVGPSPAAAANEADSATTVTVNGHTVSLDANGSMQMNVPGGGHLEVSGGNAKVSNDNSANGTSENTNNGNVHVSVNSHGSNGNSWSSTQVNGVSNNANGSSNSFTSTNVFSTDSSYNDTSSE